MRAQLLVEEPAHRLGVEDGLGLLEQVGLVGRAAALGQEQELVAVLVAGRGVGVELDLRGEVVAGVALLPHRDRRHLRVAQVERCVRVVDALAQRDLVVARREHLLAALAHDDGGARVLAHGQHASRRDVGVLEQVEGDEAVVGARLGIVEDVAQLLEVPGSQQVLDVADRGRGEQPQRRRLDLQEGSSTCLDGGHTLGREQPVGRLVGAEGEQVGVGELGHGTSLRPPSHPSRGQASAIASHLATSGRRRVGARGTATRTPGRSGHRG